MRKRNSVRLYGINMFHEMLKLLNRCTAKIQTDIGICMSNMNIVPVYGIQNVNAMLNFLNRCIEKNTDRHRNMYVKYAHHTFVWDKNVTCNVKVSEQMYREKYRHIYDMHVRY